MGGRGRGAGRGSMSALKEQLGLTPGEALPGPVLQPPPDYPILEYYPAPLLLTPDHLKQLEYKASVMNHLSRLKPAVTPRGPSSAYKTEDEDRVQVKLELEWSRFPAELRPNTSNKRKSNAPSTQAKDKQQKVNNIDDLLDELEKKEQVNVKKEVAGTEADRDDKEVEEDEEMEDADEEMDEGTDYFQNYFDNGEGYLDDDDDADDGPIY